MDKKDQPAGIRPHGDGIQIRLWKNGEEVYSKVHPGSYYNTRDLRAATKLRDKLKSRLDFGLPLYEGDQAHYSFFYKDCQDYLDVQTELDLSTALGYESILNKHWIPAFGKQITQEITTKMIKKALADMDVGPKTKRNALSVLSLVLTHAEVNPNPCTPIKFKRKKKDVERFLPYQRAALMKEIDKLNEPDISCYFALLFGCGLRPQCEPLGLKHTDWQEPYLTIERTIVRRRLKISTKTHENRRVYVPTWVRPYIEALPSRFEGEWLFNTKHGGPHLDGDRFNKAWRKVFNGHEIKRKLKLAYRIPYVCRHTRAAELLSTGVEPADAAAQLGHTLETFFRVYADFIKEYSKRKDDSRFEGYGLQSPVTDRPQKEVNI